MSGYVHYLFHARQTNSYCSLKVGGIKEKLLAAHRAGLTTVIIPAANKKDLADIPNSVLVNLIPAHFVFQSLVICFYMVGDKSSCYLLIS